MQWTYRWDNTVLIFSNRIVTVGKIVTIFINYRAQVQRHCNTRPLIYLEYTNGLYLALIDNNFACKYIIYLDLDVITNFSCHEKFYRFSNQNNIYLMYVYLKPGLIGTLIIIVWLNWPWPKTVDKIHSLNICEAVRLSQTKVK